MDSSGQSGQGGRPSDPNAPGGSGGSWQTPTGGSGSWQSTPTGGSGSWQSQPGSTSQPGTSSPSSAPPTWQSTPEQPPAAGGWQTRPAAPATAVPGAAGFYYADVPNRVIALIIDVIILAIVQIVVGIVLAAVVGPTTTVNPGATDFNNLVTVNWAAAFISAVVNAIISAAYFIWSWTSWRASPGMRVLGMQVGSETDGATLTMNQAVTRWALLFLPAAVSSALVGLPALGALIGLLGFIWWIALLVTTAQSATKQGLHDRYAHTVVVKAGRSAT